MAAHSVFSLLNKSADYLKTRGSSTPRLDAELLLAEVLGTSRVDLYINFEQPLRRAEIDRYRELVKRRAKGEPAAYILGRAGFRNLTLKVSPRVLIPRPETEQVVDVALKLLKGREWKRPPAVLDLGTGSGAIAISIAAEFPDAEVTATDADADALSLAEANALAAGVAARVSFAVSDLFEALDPVATFDLIICNPPYIADEEWDSLPPDVRDYEPEAALRGGPGGLDYYRRLAPEAHQFLKPRGLLVLEIGHTQGPAVTELLEEAGRFESIEVLKDYAGRNRVVVAHRD